MSNPELPPMNVPILGFLEKLLACVCSHVELYGQGPVCWCGIYPGALPSFEDCDTCGDDVCGMAYIRPGNAFPYSTFPQSALDDNCQLPLAYSVDVGIQRCFPTMDDDGSFPDAEVVTEAAYGLMVDQMALHRAIRCCTDSDYVVALESWTPTGPGGGCVGGQWRLYVDPVNGVR